MTIGESLFFAGKVLIFCIIRHLTSFFFLAFVEILTFSRLLCRFGSWSGFSNSVFISCYKPKHYVLRKCSFTQSTDETWKAFFNHEKIKVFWTIVAGTSMALEYPDEEGVTSLS